MVEGWDSGSSYYVPTLRRECSVIGQGYDRYTNRFKVVSWVVLPLVPLYWFIQCLLITYYVLERFMFWLSDDTISYLVPRDYYR